MSATPYSREEIAGFGLSPERLPRHVAFIMDGNGRWALARGLPRIEGHREGAGVARMVIEESARLGLEQVTLFCLSSENWKRPADELRRVARYQRWLIASVVIQVTLWVAWLILSAANQSIGVRWESFLLQVTVILGCVGGVYAFLIYWTVRDPFWAVAMGLASVPPFLGVFALAVVNGTVTK